MVRRQTTIEMIADRLAGMGINRTELASRCGEHIQTVSAILNGRRDIPLALSIRMDDVLGFAPGTIAQAQTSELVEKEIKRMQFQDMQKKRMELLEKIKAAGGFWSYQGIPEHLPDDAVIEAALVYLDLEDMPLLFQIWSKSRIRKVWKECLVSQGRRMNILNFILATKVFHINHPDNYLTRYARQ